MTSSDDLSKLVAPSLYTQSYADLENLQAFLPEEAVVSLAREVLERLAQKAQMRPAHSEDIVALANALVGPDPKAAAALIETHHANGNDVRNLYLDFLSPAAEQLGNWWASDHLSFADVTVGTGRIYAIMRNLMRRFPPPRIPDGKRALFASVPGDDHVLGLKIAADLARDQDWEIDLVLNLDHDALITHIENSDHHIVGLSAGGIHALPDLARLVLALRVSQPSTRILVSGHIVAEATSQVELIHADAMSQDFDQAMIALNALWDQFSVT